MITFNQKVWIKPNINMNTDLRKAAKKNFGKYFFKLMNNSVIGKAIENIKNVET